MLGGHDRARLQLVACIVYALAAAGSASAQGTVPLIRRSEQRTASAALSQAHVDSVIALKDSLDRLLLAIQLRESGTPLTWPITAGQSGAYNLDLYLANPKYSSAQPWTQNPKAGTGGVAKDSTQGKQDSLTAARVALETEALKFDAVRVAARLQLLRGDTVGMASNYASFLERTHGAVQNADAPHVVADTVHVSHSSKLRYLNPVTWGRATGHVVSRALVSADTVACADTTRDPAWAWCRINFNAKPARRAGQHFWNQEDDGGFTLAKMLNVQGLGDPTGQRTYVELVSDVWNFTRVSLGGVFKSGDSASTKSKAQQFLVGGGPAVVTMLRPLATANVMNSRNLLLFRAQGAFNAPGRDSTADDSLKFGAVGADWHTTIQGTNNKIGGLLMFHGGQTFGGKAFYKAMNEKRSFFSSSFALGLVVEESVSVIYTRFLTGPKVLTGSRDLIGVSFTR